MAVARAPSSVAGRSSASATAPSSTEGVGEHQPAIAADAPDVAAGAAVHVLAHGRAAEDQGLDGEEGGVARQVDLGAPVEPGRSNRMVGCGSQARRAPAPRSSLTRMSALAVARAIDLLGRRRGDGQPRCLRPGVTLDVDAVAAREPARRVEQHGLGRRAVRRAWESARARRRPDAARRARSARPGARTPAAPSLPSVAAKTAPAASDATAPLACTRQTVR